MSATISKGKTFGATETVTNAKLHQLVDSASIANIDQTNIVASSGLVVRSASSPSDTDALHLDTSLNPVVLKGWDDNQADWLSFGFTDRGDPAAFDFVVGDLTTDGTWKDLDLSSIVPVGAKAVLIAFIIRDGVTGSRLQFRKNGNSNANAVGTGRTQVANLRSDYEVIVPCDVNRIIEYNGTNVAFTNIDIIVLGWYM